MSENASLTLSSGDLRAVFWPEAGMLCASLRFRDQELLRRIEDLESAKQKGSTAGIPLLYPWANRLAGLTYRAAGRSVTLSSSSSLLHFDNNGLPIHGVPWGLLAWKTVESKGDSALARLDWTRPELLEVFPFPHEVQMAASVEATSLTIRTTVLANGKSPVPISFGFHPYFGIPDVPRAEWHVHLPAMKKLKLDGHGIPTGASEAFGPMDEPLGDRSFDDGFQLATGPASLGVEGGHYKLAVELLEGYPYTQIFTPKGRDFIALEPMTAPTNALVTGDGLRVVPPGEQFQAAFRVRLNFK